MHRPPADAMHRDLQIALDIEAELTALAKALALEISRLPSQRRASEITGIFSQMEALKPRLQVVCRRMRKHEGRPTGSETPAACKFRRTFTKHVRRMRQSLKLWPAMKAITLCHPTPRATPLLEEISLNDSDAMLSLIYGALHKIANPTVQNKQALEYGCFADIAMPVRIFDQLLRAVSRILAVQGRSQAVRFLDVGCGGGTKLLAASAHFSFCHGLEYDADYVAAGQKSLPLMGAENCTIEHANGLTYSGYDGYDVIYFYRPLRDDALLQQLEDRIMETASRGTLLIAPYDTNLTARQGLKCACVVEPIFIVGYTQDEADALRGEAERTGCGTLRRNADYSFDTGFWASIIDVASFAASDVSEP